MTQDRPLLGISLMLGFCVLVPFADALAKIMGSRMPVLHILTIRFAFQAALLLPVFLYVMVNIRRFRFHLLCPGRFFSFYAVEKLVQDYSFYHKE